MFSTLILCFWLWIIVFFYFYIYLSESDVKDLQGDLIKLNERMVEWQMDFNHDKCKVMNIGNFGGKILTTDTT